MKNKKNSNCNNGSVEPNHNYLPTPCPGCEDVIPSSCVQYDGLETDCLGIENPLNLNDIIEGLDAVMCLLAEGGDYREYDFACLQNLNIQSEQQFVELISSIICEILGTQTPGNITSLSEIINMINNLANPKFNFPDCAEPLVNLPPDSSLLAVLTALRSAICLHRTQIDANTNAITVINNTLLGIADDIDIINLELIEHEERIEVLEGRPIGVLTDELVKVSPSDTTPGYLLSKFDTAGSNIALTKVNSGSNEKIKLFVDIPIIVDEKVKTWSGDTAGFLEGKITSVNAPGIELVTTRVGNVLQNTPTLLFDIIAGQVLNLFVITPALKDQFCAMVADCIGEIIPCDPPGELLVTAAGVDYISVQWNATPQSTATGYILEYKLTTDVVWTVLSVPNTQTTRTITGLLPGTSYNIRIKTDCGITQSNYTSSTPNPASTSCPLPTNLQVSFS